VVARHKLVQVLLDQPERIARLYLGQHLHHTVQQIREARWAAWPRQSSSWISCMTRRTSSVRLSSPTFQGDEQESPLLPVR
jgi:hypothetical protein